MHTRALALTMVVFALSGCGGTTPPSSTGACGTLPSCTPWNCECATRSVTAANCVARSCSEAAAVCPAACSAAGECWKGSATGGHLGGLSAGVGTCGGTGGGQQNGGTGGGGGSTSTGTGPSCTAPEDCPYWYCNCQSGPPVNTRHCTNNRCEDAAQACPRSCRSFSSCWLGTAGGGFSGGSNAGPNACAGTGGTGGGASGSGGGTGSGGGSASSCPYGDLGKGCTQNSQCESNLCFGVSPSFLCTRGCTQTNDCPQNWVCASTNSGGKVCMPGVTGTPSTSSTCREVAHPDVGAPCGASCSSGFCTSNACTRRCRTNSDCPSPWRCLDGTSFDFCAP